MAFRITINKCLLLFFILPFFTFSQVNFEAGSDEEYALRDLQLLQQIPPHYSFTVRPLFFTLTDSTVWDKGYFIPIKPFKKVVDSKYISVKALPLSYRMQWNTHSVWGRNNGSFINSKGFQQIMQAGFEVNSDLLDIRVAPDLLFVNDTSIIKKTHVFGGQSMVRLKAGRLLAITAGTQQLWWGPAVFNSLMMSNNAPGFPHLSLHTYKPLQLPMGTIEFQLNGGHLQNRLNWPMENFSGQRVERILPGNIDKKRYFSGLNFAFQPIFMPGFTVGINRVFQFYLYEKENQGNILQKYLPVLTSLFKNKIGNGGNEIQNRDQLINIFARYIFKEHHLEVYGEFGWNDHKYNLRDLASNPDHAAAYNIGVRKIFPVKDKLFYTIEMEITQMAPTNSDIARSSGNWYEHSRVREGYTHMGQIIGGGVTLGDNTATFRVSRTTDKSKQSILIERYQHDPQFNAIKWTDWCLAVRHQQYWKTMTVSAGMDFVRRINYQHAEGNAFNLQPSLKILYNW